MKSKRPSPRPTLSKARLDAMIEEATVDAHDDSEQLMGFFYLIEEHLELPFRTAMLGIEVTVEALELTDEEQIVAVCRRGRSRQRVLILDLPLPNPPPSGAEWIEAFRRWGQGRWP